MTCNGPYICHASARPPAFQSTVPHFPSSLDGMRNRKAQTGLVRQSAVIEHHPLNRTQPHFHVAKPQPIRGFPPLSLRRSDVDNEHDVTLHIKASASACSCTSFWDWVLSTCLAPSFGISVVDWEAGLL